MGDWLKPPTNTVKYVLCNTQIPPGLCGIGGDEFHQSDLLVVDGKIADMAPAGEKQFPDVEKVDVDNGIVMSAFVDCHVHLDKAHVAQWHDFPPCDLERAKAEMTLNKAEWSENDLAARVEFSLQSTFACGTRAMRSHVDYSPETLPFIWDVMRDAANRWKGRVDVQLCPLSSIELFTDKLHHQSVFGAASITGVLGLFVYDQPDLTTLLTPVFEKAQSLGIDIDLHVDEGLDENLDGLNAVVNVVQQTGFTGTVLCGHCVALSIYGADRRANTIKRAVEAGLHFVTLPVTNLYLQDRYPGHAPKLRGMAPVIEMVNTGAHVSIGVDNVRDGFCAFGEFDPLAALVLSAQIAHLHDPARDWSSLVTSNPATTMGLDWNGMIETDAPADLIVFSARNSSELCARQAAQKVVLRGGKWIDTTLPDYRLLDEMRKQPDGRN